MIRNYYNSELKYNNTSNHLYRINVNNRKNFITYMKENNITTGVHYSATHTMDVYKKYCTNNQCVKSKCFKKIK